MSHFARQKLPTFKGGKGEGRRGKRLFLINNLFERKSIAAGTESHVNPRITIPFFPFEQLHGRESKLRLQVLSAFVDGDVSGLLQALLLQLNLESMSTIRLWRMSRKR